MQYPYKTLTSAYNTHTIAKQYTYNTHTILIQLPYSTHTISLQYPYNTNTIPIKYPSITNTQLRAARNFSLSSFTSGCHVTLPWKNPYLSSLMAVLAIHELLSGSLRSYSVAISSSPWRSAEYFQWCLHNSYIAIIISHLKMTSKALSLCVLRKRSWACHFHHSPVPKLPGASSPQ